MQIMSIISALFLSSAVLPPTQMPIKAPIMAVKPVPYVQEFRQYTQEMKKLTPVINKKQDRITPEQQGSITKLTMLVFMSLLATAGALLYFKSN